MKRPIVSIAAAVAFALSAGAQMQDQGQQQPSPFGQQQPTGFGQQPSGFSQQPSPYIQPAPRGFQTPGQVDYSKLSGTWLLSTRQGNDSTAWKIQVSPNGQFQGTQPTKAGVTRMAGRFQGPVGQAQFVGINTRTKRPLPPAPVQLQFDGGCHVQMMMQVQGGQPLQGVFHVNHPAGAPCPQ